MKERVGGVFLLQRVQELLKPDQERTPKIIPEPPAEQRSRPGRYLPVIIKDCNSRCLELRHNQVSHSSFLSAWLIRVVPREALSSLSTIYGRGDFFIESAGGAGGRSPLAGGSGDPPTLSFLSASEGGKLWVYVREID